MTEGNKLIEKRYDCIVLFDVKDGNPNGDPDAGNQPRIDPETGHGLITDVCIKRKIRNYVSLVSSLNENHATGLDIYVKERGILANEHKKAYFAVGDEEGSSSTNEKARLWMLKNYFDVRTFGAIMNMGKTKDEEKGKKQKHWNCGVVKGPVQITFARSIDPVVNLEHSITRVALTNANDTKRETTTDSETGEEKAGSGQFGKKNTISYGLYQQNIFVSPFLAKDTGFTESDLELLWKAIENMFENDRSSSHGQMSTQALIIFEHSNALGDAPAHKLFERVNIVRKDMTKPIRSIADYNIQLDGKLLDLTKVRLVISAK